MTRTVLTAEFAHETNTFASTPTDRAAFEARYAYAGEEVAEKLRGTNTELGGAIDVADREGVDLVHTVAANATPGGPVTADAYDFYTGRIVSAARERAGELDGVFLALHGAMVPEGMDDGEGPLASRVREAVGDLPIVVTHDLHANVSDELVETADAIVAYETYPHVDMGDTGRTGMRLLIGTMRGEIDPVTHVERPPVLASGVAQNTAEAPMSGFEALARELEARGGVVKVSVLPGFFRADVPTAGFSTVVVAEDGATARTAAREMARAIWERRREFAADHPGPAEAVAEARELAAGSGKDDGPVVLADVGDNPGGGGTGDETAVLRELIEQGARNAGLVTVYDPEAVGRLVEAGVRERATVELGGKASDSHTDPIRVDGYVEAITDGRFENTGPMRTGAENDTGRTVLVRCGTDDGVRVVVTEERIQPLDAELWRHVGVQPERLDLIVVKSSNHYRADYGPMASRVIPVDGPGLNAMDPRSFEYDRMRRPVFPLDAMDDGDYPDP